MGNRTAIDILSIIPITQADLDRGLTPAQVDDLRAALNLRPLLEALLELSAANVEQSASGSRSRKGRAARGGFPSALRCAVNTKKGNLRGCPSMFFTLMWIGSRFCTPLR